MFKINIADKTGKTFRIESEAEELSGKEIREKIQGSDISPELKGYEFEITGASDKAGFAAKDDVAGIGLGKILITFGKYMSRKPKREGKKQIGRNRPKGLRMRKTVRGKIISTAITQINLKITKEGSKKLSEIFPEQNQPKAKAEEAKAE